MVTQTIAASRPKVNKAFYATLDNEQYGVLTQDEHGAVWFRNESTDALTLITPEMYPFVMAHGEVGLATVQHTADVRKGGAVTICTTRAMEIQ